MCKYTRVKSGYILIETIIMFAIILMITLSSFNFLIKRKAHIDLLKEDIFQNEEFNLQREVLLKRVSRLYINNAFSEKAVFLTYVEENKIQFDKSYVEIIDDKILLHLATNNLDEEVELYNVAIINSNIYFSINT
ncbi:hypothetical protein [Clostridium sp. DL1XJH146]